MEKFIDILESEEFKQKIQDAIEEAVEVDDWVYDGNDETSITSINGEEATENVIEVIKSYLTDKNA